MRDCFSEFAQAMRDQSIEPPQFFTADGKIHRFSTNGKSSDTAGWYSLTDGDRPYGFFGDWRSDSSHDWSYGADGDFDEAKREEYKERRRRARQEHERIKQEGMAETAGKAAEMLEAAQDAGPTHPYLARKQIKAHGARVGADGVLLVPMYDIDGKLWNLERIHPTEPVKKGLYMGRRRGLFHMIGAGRSVYVCEGFATGASIHEATGAAVAVAFNAGNLMAVTRSLVEHYQVTICGDDDLDTDGNPGRTKALEAGAACGVDVVFPDFGPGREVGWTDFNDLMVAQGLEEVRSQLVDERWLPRRESLEVTEAEMAEANLTPQCFIKNYLYAQVALLVAAGGVGKTTTVIKEAIHLSLGWPLYGLEVIKQGWTLFFTKEDERELLVARLRELMKAMNLTVDERKQVLRDFMIIDLTGTERRLVFINDNNIIPTKFADDVIEAYKDDPPAMLCIDPLVSFGADETRVNVNEQAIINVCRKLMKGLNCCVRLVHHVGQEAAREGQDDAYTGRGGSALPDGSRMVAVMRPYIEKKDGRPPESLKIGPKTSVSLLLRPKLSFSPPGLPAIWIAREGYDYQFAYAIPRDPSETVSSHADQILRFLASRLKRDPVQRFAGFNSLVDCSDELSMSRREIGAAIARLDSEGRLVHLELPKIYRQGSKKTFMCPIDLVDWYTQNHPSN